MILRSTSTHGSPGASAARLALRRRVGAWAWLSCGLVAGAVLAIAGSPLAAVVAIAAAWLGHRRLLHGAHRARAGAQAEVAVAHHLRRTRAAAVLFDVRLPGGRGDADAVLVGPMVAVVEIKRGAGRIRWYPDGRVKAGRRAIPGRPLHQVVAQAATLRSALDFHGYVDAVLCVTHMRQRPRRASVNGVTVWITSARHLRRTLRRLPRQIDRREAQELSRQLG